MKTTGSGSGTPKGAAGAGQYSPYAHHPYGQPQPQQQQQQQQANSLHSYRGGRSRGHGGALLRYSYASKRSPLQAAAQDDTDGASRVQLLMQHQQRVMAMQSEHARKMHEADRATVAAVTAVLSPAAAAAAAAKKKCTPLGANGRPLQLQDGADGKAGMAPGSAGGPPSGKRRAKPKSKEYYYRDEPQSQVDDPEIMPPLQPYRPPAQPCQHPSHPYQNQPHPHPCLPAVSPHYSQSPPSHFTFDTAHVEASRTAAAAAYTAHAGAGAGAATAGASATPVAVTPGGTVAALAAPVAPAGAPIAPGGATAAATSIRSASGHAMTCVNGQLRLSDGTLMLASEEDGTTSYLKDISGRGRTIDMAMLLLPDHIRLVRESVEVFCATEPEDIEVIEVIEDAVESEGQEKGRANANEKRTRRTTAIGQMGLRCVHCRHLDGQETATARIADDDMPQTAPNAAFYPTNLEDIYECVVAMANHHFAACPHFPPKRRLRQLLAQEEQKTVNAAEDEQRKEAVKAFFISAAEKMGLSNNPEGWGIRYGSTSLSASNSTPKEVDPTALSAEEETAAEVADAVAIACGFGADVDAVADEVGDWGDKEKDASTENANSIAIGLPSPRPRSMRREIRSRPSISSQGAQDCHAVLGNGACKPLLTPNAGTGDHYQGDDMEALQLAKPPPYDSILNFPLGKRKEYGIDDRLCVMCGLFFPTAVRTYPLDKAQQKKRADNPRYARKGGATTIPPQNKGVCTVCDVVVWKQISTGYQLKFCKGKSLHGMVASRIAECKCWRTPSHPLKNWLDPITLTYMSCMTYSSCFLLSK